jgi:serine/threonine protein phosphatase 1
MAMRDLLRWGEKLGFRAREAPARRPRAPDGMRIYAVGDVHGHLGALERMLAAIAEDATQARRDGCLPLLVFLGDYVDRGADSRGVLDRLSGGALPGVDCRFLLGNHEAVLLDFLDEPANAAEWLDFGGVETLASYGVVASFGLRERGRCEAVRDRFAETLPEIHRAFLEGLEAMIVLGDYVFVHAGIRPGRRLDKQSLDDLLWIREPFLSDTRMHEKVVVHGHTVIDEPELLPNRICVDTGAYATGVLTAIVLQGDEQWLIQVRA